MRKADKDFMKTEGDQERESGGSCSIVSGAGQDMLCRKRSVTGWWGVHHKMGVSELVRPVS